MNYEALKKTYEVEFKLKNGATERYVMDKNTTCSDITKAIADKHTFTEYAEYLEITRVSEVPGEAKPMQQHLDDGLLILEAKLDWDRTLGGVKYSFLVHVKNGTTLEAATRWRDILAGESFEKKIKLGNGWLRIRIVKATGLGQGRHISHKKCDPYGKVKTYPGKSLFKYKTQAKRDEVDPLWDKEIIHKLASKELDTSHGLLFQVCDRAYISKNRVLGSTQLDWKSVEQLCGYKGSQVLRLSDADGRESGRLYVNFLFSTTEIQPREEEDKK
eukprot:TRINITY_DN7716_c0_g1_i1.p1 TRINITY_DN7716_c0_g1~~TRINITY_DN7716_c0_g1_i1.p1  ORF type:complete len:273 (-),score=57.54 TRINITY_DN7716_c0_g1_i1:63-881(-)